jgi:hypothetical protein
MNLTGIISISGKPGLFKVVAQGKNNIIVESLIDNKRFPAYSTDRISALEDISIYTIEEDVPLKDVLTLIFKKENGGACPSHKDSLDKLEKYLSDILPTYDSERVYPSDIKKLFQWYNLLQKADLLKLEEEKKDGKTKDSKEEATDASADTKKSTAKKAPAKKATTAKAPGKTTSAGPVNKKVSSAAKGGAKKSSSAKTSAAKKG